LQKLQIAAFSFFANSAIKGEGILQRVRKTNPFTRQDMRDESCALDNVGWEATGWKITFQFPIGSD
jgi:hypothetical protein